VKANCNRACCRASPIASTNSVRGPSGGHAAVDLLQQGGRERQLVVGAQVRQDVDEAGGDGLKPARRLVIGLWSLNVARIWGVL